MKTDKIVQDVAQDGHYQLNERSSFTFDILHCTIRKTVPSILSVLPSPIYTSKRYCSPFLLYLPSTSTNLFLKYKHWWGKVAIIIH